MSCFLIIAAIGYLLPICLVQPPDKQEPPFKQESAVPLTQLPWANGQTVVVTDDLKKALDALGASSVVISAERYREMMNQLKAQAGSGEKRSSEMLFSRCHISGEVKNQDGHEVAQLHFDLECRTHTPRTEVPLPFKGLRFTSANVNNETPIFGPDTERPSLIISKAEVVKIHLEAWANLSRNGNEFRLNLPRIPAAAMTSLDFTVLGQVKEASIHGYGNVNVSKKNSTSGLQASALGVLSSLDLVWRLSAPDSSGAIPTIESDTKITLDDSSALVEVTLSPVPSASVGLPWSLRLPTSAMQIKAELIRPASAISEPLAVKKNSDGTIVLSSRYTTGAAEYTQVYLRYKQALPSPNTTEKTILGMCEVLAPADRQQSGVITVKLPEDAVVLLRPINLIRADAQSNQEGKRTLSFRFTGPGAGLEAVPLPRSIIRGAVEVKLQHTLSVHDGEWTLLTDLDVTRSFRAQPALLDFFWPADWPVNRKILFSPIVRDIDQDQANHHLRLRLDGTKVGSFTLHFQSAPVASPSAINLRFPYLASVQNSQENPMEIVLAQERLRVEPHGCKIKFLGEANGVEEVKSQNSGSELRDVEFSITGHPATLSVTKEALSPAIQSHADVYFDPKLLQIAQTFRIKFDGTTPKHFPILCPIALKHIQFTLAGAERAVSPNARVATSSDESSVPLKAIRIAREGNDLWDRYLLEVPEASNNNFDFTVLATLEHNLGTVTVPLIRSAETEPLSPNNLSVRCVADRRISLLKLPAELPGWTIVSQADSRAEGHIKQLVLQSAAPERLLALQIEDRKSDYAANSPACQVRQAHIEIQPAGDGITRCRGTWQLREVGSTQLTLSVKEPFQDLNVDRCLVNGKPVSTTTSWNSDQGCTQVPITLQPQNLLQPTEIMFEFTLVRRGFFRNWWTTIPRISFEAPGASEELYPQSWRIYTGRSSWLLYANSPPSWRRSILFPCEAGADESYQFQTIDSSASLSMCTLPRSAIVLACSFFAFLAIKFTGRIKRQRKWSSDQDTVKLRKANLFLPFSPFMGLLLLSVAGFLFLFPVTTVALAWGALPGIAAGIVLVCLERVLAGQRSKQHVFFATGRHPIRESNHLLTIRPSVEHEEAARMSSDPTYCPPSNGASS